MNPNQKNQTGFDDTPQFGPRQTILSVLDLLESNFDGRVELYDENHPEAKACKELVKMLLRALSHLRFMVQGTSDASLQPSVAYVTAQLGFTLKDYADFTGDQGVSALALELLKGNLPRSQEEFNLYVQPVPSTKQ